MDSHRRRIRRRHRQLAHPRHHAHGDARRAERGAPALSTVVARANDEPAATGANPEVAMAAAAAEVLLLLHPGRQADTLGRLRHCLVAVPERTRARARARSWAPPSAVPPSRGARTTGSRIRTTSWGPRGPDVGGRRRTSMRRARRTTSRPFLFSSVSDVPIPPPPTARLARISAPARGDAQIGSVAQHCPDTGADQGRAFLGLPDLAAGLR